MGIFKEKKIIVPKYWIFFYKLTFFLNMEQFQIAFSSYYDIIRDNENSFEKIHTNIY